MKKYLLLFSLLFWAGSAAAVDGKLVCPDAEQEGARLVCEVQLANYGCNDVKITRSMAMFVGNSSGTLGGTGIWGPFVRGFLTNKIIPAAVDCAVFPVTPGIFTSNIRIIDPVPSVAPTVGAAMLEIELTELNPFNPLDADDSISIKAMVEVLPSP